jgi:GTPase SAR1 family protein
VAFVEPNLRLWAWTGNSPDVSRGDETRTPAPLRRRVSFPGGRAGEQVTCPYCFAGVPRQRIAFRCVGRGGRGDGCAAVLDERLAGYTGSTANASLPPVFAAPGRRSRADCPDCGKPTGRRVCPECHNALPSAYCDSSGRIVALVGAKNAGKSTYIAVLLHELMNRVGTELDASLVACDDRTIDRYKHDFARPLYDLRRLLPTTPSAATTPREPMVFLLTRTLTRARGSRWRSRDHSLALVLFDTAGEDLRSRDVRDLHLRYLEAADAIIFLVDPLELAGAESALAHGALPSGDPDSEPINVLARVTESLRQRHEIRPGQRLQIPVAVALTKVDALGPAMRRQSALHRSRGLPGRLDLDDREAVHEQVKSLLDGWQAGQLSRYLEQQYHDYALFGLSALGGVPQDGQVGSGGVRPHRVEDPLLWLLYRFGLLEGGRG